MSYELILNAARNCDEEALKLVLVNIDIDCFKPGTLRFSAGTQLALENNNDITDLQFEINKKFLVLKFCTRMKQKALNRLLALRTNQKISQSSAEIN